MESLSMTVVRSAKPSLRFVWFAAADGTVLDPSDMANALAIATNGRSSFAAFEDDDRNGIEDHRR
jgi:hypothetical protein